MNALLAWAIIILAGSAAGMSWAIPYRQDHPMAAVGALFGATDPTYTLAGFVAGGSVLMFLVGIGLLIAGLVRATQGSTQATVAAAPASGLPKPSFDQAKWNALLQYDAEITTAEQQVRPLGTRWVDELATSFLALNDKAYLPGIVDKIRDKATAEAEALADRKALAANRQKDAEKNLEARLEAQRIRRALWLERLWGTPFRRTLSAGTVLAIVCGVFALLFWPATPISDSIVWKNASLQNCNDTSCLADAMRKSNASADAVQFAETLSALRKIPSWAAEYRHYGPVDLVLYDQAIGYSGGFVFVNSKPSIVPDPYAGDDALRNFSVFSDLHPNAFQLRGTGLVSEETLPNGGQRFVFATPVGECEACGPEAMLKFAYEFDVSGHLSGTPVLGLVGQNDVSNMIFPPNHP